MLLKGRFVVSEKEGRVEYKKNLKLNFKIWMYSDLGLGGIGKGLNIFIIVIV